jgi:hypothetical protein
MSAKPPCCSKPQNLEEKRLAPDLVVRVCKTCGRRHFELTAAPGSLGLKGAGL